MDRRLWAAPAAALLALSLFGVAAAKDGALASLETPIPPDADPGTEVDVAWRAWMPDAGTDWPFSGSPVFIRLISADGGRSTETMGRESPSGSGHYEATITIPPGGVGLVEVGLFGESCVEGTCTRSDLLFELPEHQRVPADRGSSRGRAAGDRGASWLNDRRCGDQHLEPTVDGVSRPAGRDAGRPRRARVHRPLARRC